MQSNMLTTTFTTFTAVSVYDGTAELFSKALTTGRNRKIISLFTRRPTRLLDLGSLQSRMASSGYAGQKEVALDDIRGSEGRIRDFDDRFNPLTDRVRERWMSVARAHEAGIDLPPIELVQVGKVYYVRDGNHRVSVARANGRPTITARVTVW